MAMKFAFWVPSPKFPRMIEYNSRYKNYYYDNGKEGTRSLHGWISFKTHKVYYVYADLKEAESKL